MTARLLIYVFAAILSLCLSGVGKASEPDYQLALRHARQAEWKSAEIALNRLLGQSPGYMPAVLLKARVLFATGRYAEALQTARQFIEHEPENGEAHKLAALACFMTGDQQGAGAELQKAVKLAPGDAESFYYLGRVYFTASNLPGALSAFESAVRLDPGSVRAYNHLGQTLEGLARFADAKAAYLTAIKLEAAQKTRSEWPFHNLGALLLQQGELTEAAEYFHQALARNPKLVASKVKLAMTLSLSGKLADALVLLEEAISLEPRSADAHYQLGRLLTKMGRQEEARKHYAAFQELQKK